MDNIFAAIGGLLAIISVFPYLVDIVKKRTKPNIVSWITWMILTVIGAAATFSAGEYKTAVLLIGSTICTLLVVLLGLKYGIAKFSKFDGFCWVGAAVGLILWFLFDSPTIAITATVAIDLIGALPTVRHAWINPGEETWQTFVIGTTAPLFTILSMTTYTFDGLISPIYLSLANGTIAAVIVYRRKQKGISLKRHSVHETLHE